MLRGGQFKGQSAAPARLFASAARCPGWVEVVHWGSSGCYHRCYQ
jgi:hypothetical protein